MVQYVWTCFPNLSCKQQRSVLLCGKAEDIIVGVAEVIGTHNPSSRENTHTQTHTHTHTYISKMHAHECTCSKTISKGKDQFIVCSAMLEVYGGLVGGGCRGSSGGSMFIFGNEIL